MAGAGLIVALIGCRHPTATVTGFAMGGAVRIQRRCPTADHSSCEREALVSRDDIAAMEHDVTDWKDDAPIAVLNSSGGPTVLPERTAALMAAALRLAEATGGAFDPTVRPYLRGPPGPVGWPHVQLHGTQASFDQGNMALTLDGISQGAVASWVLAGLTGEVAVDVTGDVCVRGRWSIAVADPRDAGVVLGTVSLRDACLSTSANLPVAHVLDPRSGVAANGAVGATVVAADGAVADALDTALLVLGADEPVVDALGAWALVVMDDRVVEIGERPSGLRWKARR